MELCSHSVALGSIVPELEESKGIIYFPKQHNPKNQALIGLVHY